MNSDNIWALRGVASHMGQVGHLAVVALCDDLLAARKERDAAESALENIRSARNANADAAQATTAITDRTNRMCRMTVSFVRTEDFDGYYSPFQLFVLKVSIIHF